jgi:hypothetical protein
MVAQPQISPSRGMRKTSRAATPATGYAAHRHFPCLRHGPNQGRMETQRHMPSSIIQLLGSEPIARGIRSQIFQHPHDSELLIKVARPDYKHHRKLKYLLIERQRYGPYIWWAREIREYLALRSRLRVHPPWLQRFIGFVETDLGLGLVVGKVHDGTGRLAPTLEQTVAETGLTLALRRKVDKLQRELLAHEVILGDAHPRNILLAPAPEGTALVIIDGLGDKNIIRLESISTYLSRHGTRRRFARLMAKLEQIDRARACALVLYFLTSGALAG